MTVTQRLDQAHASIDLMLERLDKGMSIADLSSAWIVQNLKDAAVAIEAARGMIG